MITSTKKFGPISTGHRQWRDNGHCRWIHGYGRYVEITFTGEQDHRGWVMDFGALKGVKAYLEQHWDHKLLIASDDPGMSILENAEEADLISMTIMDVTQGHGPGMEGSAKWVYDKINPMILSATNDRVRILSVRVWEHDLNSAIYQAD